MLGSARQRHRPGVDNDNLATVAYRLADGQGQHRPFCQRVGTKEDYQVALAEFFLAANLLAKSGRQSPGGTVTPLVSFVNKLLRTGCFSTIMHKNARYKA
jgi:hypothetical protein